MSVNVPAYTITSTVAAYDVEQANQVNGVADATLPPADNSPNSASQSAALAQNHGHGYARTDSSDLNQLLITLPPDVADQILRSIRANSAQPQSDVRSRSKSSTSNDVDEARFLADLAKLSEYVDGLDPADLSRMSDAELEQMFDQIPVDLGACIAGVAHARPGSEASKRGLEVLAELCNKVRNTREGAHLAHEIGMVLRDDAAEFGGMAELRSAFSALSPEARQALRDFEQAVAGFPPLDMRVAFSIQSSQVAQARTVH